MIDDAVKYIVTEIKSGLSAAPGDVFSGDIHALKDDNKRGVYVSVVNLQEETVLRNTPHYVQKNNQVHYKEPPVFLNVFLLIAFNFPEYEKSVLHLSETVEMFQHRRTLNASNAAVAFPAGLEKLVFDLHNLDLEQLNQVWGVLGGAYLPSVLYKVRLVRVQRDETVRATEIRTIELETSPK